jgi:nicotinate dehydrogenase subunit B
MNDADALPDAAANRVPVETGLSTSTSACYRWVADEAATVTMLAEGALSTIVRNEPSRASATAAATETLYRAADVDIRQLPPVLEHVDAAWHFARESLIDELRERADAPATGSPPHDTIRWRGTLLDPIAEAGGRVLIRALADRLASPVAWKKAKQAARGKGLSLGRGIAYATLSRVDAARDLHDTASDIPVVTPSDHAPSYMAWIVELAVNQRTGAMQLQRVVAGRAEGVLPEPGADPGFRIDGLSDALVEQALQGLLGVADGARRNTQEAPALTAPFDESAHPQPWVRSVLPATWAAARGVAQRFGAGTAIVGREAEQAVAPSVSDDGMTSPWQPVAAGLAAAAVANAVFAATGKRQRTMPVPFFDLEKRETTTTARTAVDVGPAALSTTWGDRGMPSVAANGEAGAAYAAGRDIRRAGTAVKATRWGGRLVATAGAMVVGALAWQGLVSDGAARYLGPLRPFRSEIPRVAAPAPDTWTAATIERGRRLAAAADCAVCHTAVGAATNTGGRPFDTPFGTVYSTNLTPDARDGIGGWSFPAFDRAMREGVSRDGRHLYPVFPYTAFSKITDADMTALYAFLMTRPAQATPPQLKSRRTALGFPWSVRPLLAGWNALYLDKQPFVPDPTRSAEWQRGAYLVEALGHCGACHTPRNAMGAERGGPGTAAYLRGGEADGWTAPALIGTGDAPQPWSESALYDYLRLGFSDEHGVAAGPMAPVVRNLSTLPDADVRAIAHYIASWRESSTAVVAGESRAETGASSAAIRGTATTVTATTIGGRSSAGAAAAATLPTAAATAATMPHNVSGRAASTAVAQAALPPSLQLGKRVFEAACAVCHTPQAGVGHFGVRPEMALNSSIQADSPDNLLRVILAGIDDPATPDLGFMPGFADAYDDEQIAALAGYLRREHAPDRPVWSDLRAASARVRTALAHEHAVQ